jgi:hypothetical protein
MPRPRSAKVQDVKTRVVTRIRESFLHPGNRFLSNRQLAAEYGISYQTAHRLIAELCAEGLLERRPASGTYLPGARRQLAGVQLLFHARARRKGSFGARLLARIADALEREGIARVVSWVDRRVDLKPDHFPVIWECRNLVIPKILPKHYGLLLNDTAPAGLAGTYFDSISTDDFSGGATAAELLIRRSRQTGGFAVLAGPKDDLRSVNRAEGFRSVLPGASIVWSGGWFREHGLRAAPSLLRRGRAGIFCCNDRLAEALVDFCKQNRRACPPLVGFDDAPIAENLKLTTIAIPWDELVAAAVTIIKKRLSGDPATATRQILAPRPVIR